jgi:hypothetical protein
VLLPVFLFTTEHTRSLSPLQGHGRPGGGAPEWATPPTPPRAPGHAQGDLMRRGAPRADDPFGRSSSGHPAALCPKSADAVTVCAWGRWRAVCCGKVLVRAPHVGQDGGRSQG